MGYPTCGGRLFHAGCDIATGVMLATKGEGSTAVAYTPKTTQERERRIARALKASGPFFHIPGRKPHEVAFVSRDGRKVHVDSAEMCYNDMLLTDEISDDGKDGPLYRDILDAFQLEVLEWARAAFQGTNR